MWGNPLKPKKEGGSTKKTLPNIDVEEKFKPEKLTLTKTEAKKILDCKKTLTYHQTEWVQNYMMTVIRERSYPPQLAGCDAYGQIMRFLNPNDALLLLQTIRADYAKIQPIEKEDDNDFAALHSLELGTYHEHLPPPQVSAHNSH